MCDLDPDQLYRAVSSVLALTGGAHVLVADPEVRRQMAAAEDVLSGLRRQLRHDHGVVDPYLPDNYGDLTADQQRALRQKRLRDAELYATDVMARNREWWADRRELWALRAVAS